MKDKKITLNVCDMLNKKVMDLNHKLQVAKLKQIWWFLTW